MPEMIPLVGNLLKLLSALLGGLLIGVGCHRHAGGPSAWFPVLSGMCCVIIIAGNTGIPELGAAVIAFMVAGIGLLGAVVLMRSRDLRRSIPIALCIWVAGGLGISFGKSLFIEGMVLAIVSYLMLEKTKILSEKPD